MVAEIAGVSVVNVCGLLTRVVRSRDLGEITCQNKRVYTLSGHTIIVKLIMLGNI